MDLSSLANLKFGGKAISWSLRSLTEKLFSIQLKKCNLVQLGYWEAIENSRSRLEYAAANAVASWRIYEVDELKKQILKTVTTKGDELKKNIVKMPLMACKSWMPLISDPFINSHKIKNQIVISTKSPEIITMKVVENINSGVVVHLMDGINGRHISCFQLFWTKVDLNLQFGSSPSDHGTIIVHGNGLFLIGRTAQRLLVCNPATREVVALPPATYFPDAVNKLSGIGIGLDHSNKYKAVRIFLRDSGIGGIEVITFDGGNYSSWRLLKTYPPNIMTMNLKVVTVQGASYWIIGNIRINKSFKDNNRGNLRILRFDLSSEEFTLIDSPESPDPNHVIKLAELEGHLCCYAETSYEETDMSTIFVWLYNESDTIETDRWTLRYTIRHILIPQVCCLSSFMPIAIDQEGCLLFECLQHMHRYDPRTDKFYRTATDDLDADSLEIKTWYCHTTSYVETLGPLSTTTCD